MKALWDSTASLFQRFGVRPTLDEQGRVMFEEVWEFAHAISDTEMVEDSVYEAADVIVTMMAMLQITGFIYEEFEQAIAEVAAKNDAKTFETHYIRESDGKIARREK